MSLAKSNYRVQDINRCEVCRSFRYSGIFASTGDCLYKRKIYAVRVDINAICDKFKRKQQP